MCCQKALQRLLASFEKTIAKNLQTQKLYYCYAIDWNKKLDFFILETLYGHSDKNLPKTIDSWFKKNEFSFI